MWWILTLVGALAVIAGLRLWFAPPPPPPPDQLPDNHVGRVAIPCGRDEHGVHPVRRITYTAATLLLVRVDHQCNDEEPVTIALEPAAAGGQLEPLVRPDLLTPGRTGFTFAVRVPQGRTLRLGCGGSLTRHDDCVFFLQNATTRECDLQNGAQAPRIEGRCGTEIDGQFYNVSGRQLRVRVVWQGNACGVGGVAHVRLSPIGAAPGTGGPWSPPAAGSPLEIGGRDMDDGECLRVQCLPAGTRNDCRFQVHCVMR